MDEIKKEIDGATPASDEGKTLEPSHKTENKSEKPERTEKEKAEYSFRMTAKRIKELGGNPAEILGIKPNLEVDEEFSDDKPLTVGDLRKIQRQEVKKTSLQIADEIEDEAEREEVKRGLNRLTPSNDPLDDVAFVRRAVNSERTEQIAEEANRRGRPERGAAGGNSPKKVEDPFEATPQELETLKLVPNIKPERAKELILKARKEAQDKKKS